MKYSLFIFLILLFSVPIFGQEFKIPSGGSGGTVIIYGSGSKQNKDFSFQKTSEKYMYRDNNNSHLNKKYNPKSSDRDFIYYISKKYSPDAYYILSRCKHDIMEFFHKDVFDNRIDNLIASYETMVHECHHGLDRTTAPILMNLSGLSPSVEDLLRGGNTIKMPNSYFIENQQHAIVHATEIFPSKQILPLLPDSLKDKNLPSYYRIQIYIDSKNPHQSTQNMGIYGLLEEFSAYYQGMKAMYDIRKYYENESHHSSKAFSAARYFSMPLANIYSGREFKILILTYLVHAKNKHPEIYKEIMDNESFIKAFFAVEENFENLVIEAQTYQKNLLRDLEKSGTSIQIDKDRIKIDRHLIHDSLHYPEQYKNALHQKDLKEMMKILEGKRQ